MARQTQTPLIVRVFIAIFLIVGCTVVVVVGGYAFYHSLINPQPEPRYIYEPKSVKKW